jgi:hypothetical protein
LLEESIRVTFSNPVEIPGQVLPAGTYVFEDLEHGTLTRILSADETHVFATLFTVPDVRREPMEYGKVRLRETPPNTPERVDEWFYPGDSVGHEFRYPEHSRSKATSMLEAVPKSVKFVAVHADHIVVRPIGHGLKALV